MADWRMERLTPAHERSGFDCGKPPLEDFLKLRVGQYEKRNLGRAYVAVLPDQPTVFGYYTLASGAVAIEHLPEPVNRKLPRHPVPVILLARLAVDHRAQRQGLGEILLLDALRRGVVLADQLGIHAVEVDAIDEAAKAFYLKYGFIPLLDNELHLFLPIATVKDAMGTRTIP